MKPRARLFKAMKAKPKVMTRSGCFRLPMDSGLCASILRSSAKRPCTALPGASHRFIRPYR